METCEERPYSRSSCATIISSIGGGFAPLDYGKLEMSEFISTS